jgi:APA family basic amino acid/polyamine antiporter
LRRELGVGGAALMGLGSILGTGVFVSIGIAAGIAGPSVVLAVALGAVVATFNGLNSAQLAASHPVSGGTYEYGYRYLGSHLGFTAGWMFLAAKSASAATAALGFGGYVAILAGWEPTTGLLIGLGLGSVVVLTVIVLSGIRRSNVANTVVVSITVVALGCFVVFGIPEFDADRFRSFFGDDGDAAGFLEATALMFVAYTGYGRIATLGEEVRSPRRTIPRAIVITLASTMLLYVSVAAVGVGAAGSSGLAEATDRAAAPLEVVARDFDVPGIDTVVAVGAVTAMLGVLLNLVLGLSRVLLAMGRRRDVPSRLGRLDPTGTTPTAAVIVVGIVVASLVLVGDVKTTWTFSAFTVLLYYAITNLAALRIPDAQRLFPRWVAVAGLVACLGLAFWVDPAVWAAGLGLVAAGLGWHEIARRRRGD